MCLDHLNSEVYQNPHFRLGLDQNSHVHRMKKKRTNQIEKSNSEFLIKSEILLFFE
jgi:hypothetical protein